MSPKNESAPVREIDLAAREYLAETAIAVINERMGSDPLSEIKTRILQNVRAAESERGRIVPLIERFTKERALIQRKDGGDNFLASVLQGKIDQMELNRLQIQLMIAKMNIALEMLAQYHYVREVRDAPADRLPSRPLPMLR